MNIWKSTNVCICKAGATKTWIINRFLYHRFLGRDSAFSALISSSNLRQNGTKWTYFFFFNTFTNKPCFLRVCITILLKTLWKKEKLLVTSNFSFSHSVFYPFEELSSIFLSDCRLQTLSVWKSLKFVVWERVNKEGCNPTNRSMWLFEGSN